MPIELAELQALDFDLDLLEFDRDELAKPAVVARFASLGLTRPIGQDSICMGTPRTGKPQVHAPLAELALSGAGANHRDAAENASRVVVVGTRTTNHILWHSGHAPWVQDELGIVPITGKSELSNG